MGDSENRHSARPPCCRAILIGLDFFSANAVIAALASKGCRIVPAQPTEEQIAAGWIDKQDVNPEDICRAMLNTAPYLIRVK